MTVIFLGEGFEETEAIAPYDILKRAGVDVVFAGVGGTEIKGAHGIAVKTETTVEAIADDCPEMVVLPGGLGGVNSMAASDAVRSITLRVWEKGGYVAAICAAPTLLAKYGITEGRKATCYPGMEKQMGSAKMKHASTVVDGRLITGRAPGSAIDFGLELAAALKGKTEAMKVASGLVYR